EARRAGRVDRRGHGHERVRGVQVAAEQEPGHPGAERPAAQAPLVEVVRVLGLAPARGQEAHGRDQDEEEDEDGERHAVHAVVHCCAPPLWARRARWSRFHSWYAVIVSAVEMTTHSIWYQ